MNCSPERLNKFTKFILQQRQPVTVLFFPHRDHSGCYQGFGPNDTFKWHLIVDLIYDSLILSVCEHLLMRLRDSSISMNDPFISLAHFNIGLVCVFFFFYKIAGASCVRQVGLFSMTYTANISLYFYLHLLMSANFVFFCNQLLKPFLL